MKLSNNMQGIIWISIMTLFGSIGFVIIRFLSDSDLNPFQIVFFHNFFAFIVCAPILLIKRTRIKTKRIKLYSLRAVLEFIGWSLSFFAISMIELPIHTALSYMTPLLLHTLAVLVLKEQASYHRWLAFIIGIVGVMIVIHPWENNINAEDNKNLYYAAIMMFGASSCFATCGVIIKKLTTTEAAGTITFYMVLLTCIFAIPTAIYNWQTPTSTQWALAITVGIISLIQQFTVTKAFAKADITMVIPMTFVSLIYSSVFAYLFFNEIVDIWTISGAVVILCAALYAIYHARVKEVGLDR